jgi:hypothetical protein
MRIASAVTGVSWIPLDSLAGLCKAGYTVGASLAGLHHREDAGAQWA